MSEPTNTAYPSNGMPPHFRARLEEKFADSQIRRDVKRHTDGFEPVYVEATTVIRRLNEIFGSDWDFTVGEYQFVPPTNPVQVLVKGRLTVSWWQACPDGTWSYRCTTKEQYGSCWLKFRGNAWCDLGSDVKAAGTDALKKCATLLGIALELYDKDESPMQGMHRTGEIPQQGQFPATQFNPNAPAEAFQVESVRKVFAAFGQPDSVWMAWLGVQGVHQITQGLVQQVLSGEHPVIKSLHQNAGTRPGLQASAA